MIVKLGSYVVNLNYIFYRYDLWFRVWKGMQACILYIFSILVLKAYKLKCKLDVENYCFEVNCTIISLNCLVNSHHCVTNCIFKQDLPLQPAAVVLKYELYGQRIHNVWGGAGLGLVKIL